MSHGAGNGAKASYLPLPGGEDLTQPSRFNTVAQAVGNGLQVTTPYAIAITCGALAAGLIAGLMSGSAEFGWKFAAVTAAVFTTILSINQGGLNAIGGADQLPGGRQVAMDAAVRPVVTAPVTALVIYGMQSALGLNPSADAVLASITPLVFSAVLARFGGVHLINLATRHITDPAWRDFANALSGALLEAAAVVVVGPTLNLAVTGQTGLPAATGPGAFAGAILVVAMFLDRERFTVLCRRSRGVQALADASDVEAANGTTTGGAPAPAPVSDAASPMATDAAQTAAPGQGFAGTLTPPGTLPAATPASAELTGRTPGGSK